MKGIQVVVIWKGQKLFGKLLDEMQNPSIDKAFTLSASRWKGERNVDSKAKRDLITSIESLSRSTHTLIRITLVRAFNQFIIFCVIILTSISISDHLLMDYRAHFT